MSQRELPPIRWSEAGSFNERLGDRPERTSPTAATLLRDHVWSMSHEKRTAFKQTMRSGCYKLPRSIHTDVLRMATFNAWNRLKDPIEEAMMDNVCYCIVCQLREQNQ